MREKNIWRRGVLRLSGRVRGALGWPIRLSSVWWKRLLQDKVEAGTVWMVNDILDTQIVCVAWVFSFESYIVNRNHIAISGNKIQEIEWELYDTSKIYYVRVPELNAEEKQKIRKICDRDTKVRIKVMPWEKAWEMKIIIGWGKLKYSWSIPLESKAKKEK